MYGETVTATVSAYPSTKGGNEQMGKRLEGKSCIVTGAGRGIGRGIAVRLADEGATVCVADIDGASAEEATSEIQAAGGKSLVSVVDVADRAQVVAMVRDTVDAFGRLDVIFNNAALAGIKPFMDLTETDWNQIMRVNSLGVLICMQEAARQMIAQGEGGKIINTASQTGKRAWPDWGVYSASKFAVVGITQVMAQELAPTVAVNAICPGTMLTDMARTGFKASLDEGDTLEAAFARKAETIPFGRLGTADDVGAMAAWLASDDCSFTTGATLNLTGGEEVFF